MISSRMSVRPSWLARPRMAETLPPPASACRSPNAASKALYLRSDDRAHTLCYFEGDPAEQTVGFEVEDEASLGAAAATLDALGHPVHAGTAGGGRTCAK